MNFRPATPDDHPLMRDLVQAGGPAIPSITDALVSDGEEGPRWWVVVRPYAYGQRRLQVWHERVRGEPYPEILHEL